MNEIIENTNCITKVFENHPIFIFNDNINNENNKKQYYFKANDIAKAIGIVNIRSSVQNFSDKEKGVHEVDTLGGKQESLFLTTKGVYRLLYGSKKPLAEQFRDWAGDILDDIILNKSQELIKKLVEKEEKIKQLEETHLNELLIKENENKWLHNKAQTKASYKKYSENTEGLYVGAHILDANAFIYKIGKSINIKVRENNHTVSTSDLNKFQMIKAYLAPTDLHFCVESFVQELLKPFSINETRKEHFIINTIFVDHIIKKVLGNIDSCIIDINEYIDILEDNKFNYEVVDDILKIKYEKDIKNEKTYEIDIISSTLPTDKYGKRICKRKCEKCNIIKIETEYDISPVSNKIYGVCKMCRSEQITLKKCSQCLIDKERTEYDVSTVTNRFWHNCKICRTENLLKTPLKKCGKCVMHKKKSEYYISSITLKEYPNCKQCQDSYTGLLKETKRCQKCQMDKEKSEFNISEITNKFLNHCIECNIRWKDGKSTRRCQKCLVDKLKSEFAQLDNDKLDRKCKECYDV